MIIMFVWSSTALSLEIPSSNSPSSNDLNTVNSQTLAKKINDLWGGSEKRSISWKCFKQEGDFVKCQVTVKRDVKEIMCGEGLNVFKILAQNIKLLKMIVK